MSDIKPIETHWNGYRFRSRLEARWAVFFDAAGIAFEYEPEGFELGALGRYLPDFFLPEIGTYFEVKHENFDPSESPNEVLRIIAFSKSEKQIVVCFGSPWHTTTLLLTDGARARVCAFSESISGQLSLSLVTLPRGDNILITEEAAYKAFSSPRLTQAYEEARGARFEFGEKGGR